MLDNKSFARTAILIILLYLFYLILRPFLGTLIITVVFSILTYPVFSYLHNKLKLGKTLASLTTVLATIIFVVTPLIFFLTLLVNQSLVFVSGFNPADLVVQFEKFPEFTLLGFTLDLATVQSLAFSSINDIGKFIAQNGASLLTGILNSIGLFVVFLTLYFYLLRDGKALLDQFQSVLPYSKTEKTQLIKSFSDVSKTIFMGNLLVGVTSALIAAIGFYIFGFETAIIWAALAFILAFIPTLGPIFLYLVGSVILYFTAGITISLLFIVYFIILEMFFKENYLKPKILDSKFNAHPVLVLLSLVGGVSTFGSIGLLYGPLILIFLLSLLKFKSQLK